MNKTGWIVLLVVVLVLGAVAFFLFRKKKKYPFDWIGNGGTGSGKSNVHLFDVDEHDFKIGDEVTLEVREGDPEFIAGFDGVKAKIIGFLKPDTFTIDVEHPGGQGNGFVVKA